MLRVGRARVQKGARELVAFQHNSSHRKTGIPVLLEGVFNKAYGWTGEKHCGLFASPRCHASAIDSGSGRAPLASASGLL